MRAFSRIGKTFFYPQTPEQGRAWIILSCASGDVIAVEDEAQKAFFIFSLHQGKPDMRVITEQEFRDFCGIRSLGLSKLKGTTRQKPALFSPR